MTRTELIIQLLKIVIGLAFGAYFVWWSLEVLDRLTPEDEVRAAVTNARLDPIQEAAIGTSHSELSSVDSISAKAADEVTE